MYELFLDIILPKVTLLHIIFLFQGAAAAKGKTGREAAVEMALNPEEIDEMDSEAMALRAEAALR